MREAMPDDWNSEKYRQRAEQWQKKANELPAGNERNACLVLADGYAHLAALFENSQSQP
jgi:hypothetical protein